MKKTRLIAMLLTLAMAGSLLAGCGDKNNADNEPNNQGESNTPEYLVWNIGAEPKTWDPTLSDESLSEYLTISMFEGLTRQVEDGIEPGVAETWDISDDGLTYTFHLRESNWSDGTPVTAHDFEYTWKRMCDPKVASPSASGMTDYVVGAAEFLSGTGTADGVMATALDDYTFQVVLKNPSPFFLNRISADIYCPVKKECVDQGDGWEKKPETFVCNGAFKLAEYQIGSHILMVKNDAYYEADKVKLPGIRAIMQSIILALGLTYWVRMARIVRGQVLSLKNSEFVLAAKTLGASTGRIFVKHLIPNMMGTIMVAIAMQIPNAIFTEAFLSFIGLGIPAPKASWGTLCNDALSSIYVYPYQLLIPAIAISVTILAFNLFSDGLRDAFDPKQRK